jgi:hypothetical protein
MKRLDTTELEELENALRCFINNISYMTRTEIRFNGELLPYVKIDITEKEEEK